MSEQDTHSTNDTVDRQVLGPEAGQQAGGGGQCVSELDANGSQLHRFRALSEVAGARRYHRNSGRAAAAARGGVLWVAVCKGWSCNPDRVATFLAIIERQERQS
jgi:hypothetical protein